jgi:hypothetical protein
MAPASPLRSPRSRRVAAALIALLCISFGAAVLAAPALASQTQVSILQDDPQLLHNPAATLLRFRQLGAQEARVALRWQFIAPSPNSFKKPHNFNGSNPADYSNANWAPYDAIVRDAAADGIAVNFNVVGGAPLWATGPGMPKGIKGYPFHNWEPNATAFGQFIRAIATRYSGNYDPLTKRLQPHNKADLPRVSVWSIWNEPDYGPSLAPQALPGHPGVEDSPRMYRLLVDQAWSALSATGHGSDTVLIGELAPRATPAAFGDFNGMLPLTFLKSFYCLGTNYRPLTGVAAALQGCPATAGGSRRFAADNPALFRASGFSDHPYMRWFPPNNEEDDPAVQGFSSLVKGFTTLATIRNLETALGRALWVYGVHRYFPIWNTEFGYITSPPKRVTTQQPYAYVAPATAALYDNWAEYMSWKNPDIASFEQYLLYDAEPATKADDYGGFASGLLSFNGAQKPGYAAWRLPLFLPNTVAASPTQSLEVWGAVRPVDYANLDLPYAPENAQLLFEPGGRGPFTVLATISVAGPDGYFDKRVLFPRSGILVMRWYYPTDPGFGPAAGAAVFSRPVQVTVK